MAKSTKISSLVMASPDDSATVAESPIVSDSDTNTDTPLTLSDLDSWVRGTLSQRGALSTDAALEFIDAHATAENPEIRAVQRDINASAATFRTGNYSGTPHDLSRRYAMRKICGAQWGDTVRTVTLNVASAAKVRGLTVEQLVGQAKALATFRPGIIMCSDTFNEHNGAVKAYLSAFDSPRTSADNLPVWAPIASENPPDRLRVCTWGSKAPNPYTGQTNRGKAPFKVLALEKDLSEYSDKERKISDTEAFRRQIETLQTDAVLYRATIVELEAQIAELRNTVNASVGA